MKPSYEEKRFEESSKRGQLRLIGSPDGREGSVTIHQDAQLYAGSSMDRNGAIRAQARPQDLRPRDQGRGRGERAAAHRGDAIKIAGESRVRLEKGRKAEVLLFDLA
jgi:hypothetical protein